MSIKAWAIEPGQFDAATARETRPNDDAKPMAFALFGTEALIGVSGLLTPTPILAITPAGPMPVGTSYMQTVMAIAAADADPQVKSIRIMMDSGGGMVDGVRRAMAALRDATKPTTVQVDGSCCSAAYWFASAADRIVAQSTASIGCLGVMLAKPDPEKGQRRFTSSQTPNKVPDPNSEAGEQYQRIVDDFAGQLLDDVAANRGRDRKTVAADFGKGETLPARAALKAGLIDSIVGPAIGSARPDSARAVAQDSQTPGDREKEDPMGLPIPGEMSREDMEEELLALRASAAEGVDEKPEAVDQDVDKDAEKLLDKRLDEAGASASVAADIKANAMAAELDTLRSQNAVMRLHVNAAQASERTTRIDALIKSGRIGTTDNDRALACLAYDTEQKATQAYAIANGVSLAVAAQGQSGCRLFSALEGKAAGAANAGLESTSVGGRPYAGAIDAATASASGMHAAIEKSVAGGKSYTAALAEFRTSNPGEYAAAMEG